MNTRRTGFALPAVLMGLAACAGTGPAVQSPEVALSVVEVTSLSLNRQTFVLHFDVRNPNPFPLPVRQVRYNVLLEKQRFAGGESTGRFTIPASGNGNFAVSVDLNLMQSAMSLVPVIGSGVARPLGYELQGSLDVALPFVRSLEFSSRGTISVHGDAF